MVGINSKHLVLYVIRPALEAVGLGSPEAEQLLLGTAAQESHLGHYLHQINGPALGIYQMEPATHDDIWDNFLRYKDGFATDVEEYLNYPYDSDWRKSPGYGRAAKECLIRHLGYATIMARLQYYRQPEALPALNDLEGQAKYWKKYYNTPLGKGTEQEYMENYRRLVR